MGNRNPSHRLQHNKQQRPREDASMSHKKPVHVVRFGLIKVSVWQNRKTTGDIYSVTVVRLFKNGDVWKQSTRFGRDDLPVVRLALDEAHTWVLQEIQEQRARRAGDVASTTTRAATGARSHRR
jgi:hypothetical protein